MSKISIRLSPPATVMGDYGHYYQERTASIYPRSDVQVDYFKMAKEAATLTGSATANIDLDQGDFASVTYHATTEYKQEMWVATLRKGGYYLRGPEGEAEFTIAKRGYQRVGYGRNTWEGEFRGVPSLIERARYVTFMEHPAGYGGGSIQFGGDTFTAHQSASCD